MLLILLGSLVLLGMFVTWIELLPYGLITTVRLPHWLGLAVLLLLLAWLVDE